MFRKKIEHLFVGVLRFLQTQSSFPGPPEVNAARTLLFLHGRLVNLSKLLISLTPHG